MYDPALGRWHVQDPLAEWDLRTSPYAYVGNNPIRYIDPFGLTKEDRQKRRAKRWGWLIRAWSKITGRTWIQEVSVVAKMPEHLKSKNKNTNNTGKYDQNYGNPLASPLPHESSRVGNPHHS